VEDHPEVALMERRFGPLRATSQRILIHDALSSQSRPVSAEDLYALLPKESVDLSTVYRTLDAFVKEGIVVKSFFESRGLYHLAGGVHRHVLVCLDCHATEEIDDCPFHELEDDVESKTDFQILYHPLELFGYCKNCKGKHPHKE
jgi:Fur family ferric uptake transcriptional regulator